MNVLDIMAELKVIYRNQIGYSHPRVPGLTEADVQRWSSLLGKPRSILYDEIAVHLAIDFHAFKTTFAFCDAVINDLHGVISCVDEHRPKLFWTVFLAFEAGESCRGNNSDEDPIEVYARPEIARVISSITGR